MSFTTRTDGTCPALPQPSGRSMSLSDSITVALLAFIGPALAGPCRRARADEADASGSQDARHRSRARGGSAFDLAEIHPALESARQRHAARRSR